MTHGYGAQRRARRGASRRRRAWALACIFVARVCSNSAVEGAAPRLCALSGAAALRPAPFGPGGAASNATIARRGRAEAAYAAGAEVACRALGCAVVSVDAGELLEALEGDAEGAGEGDGLDGAGMPPTPPAFAGGAALSGCDALLAAGVAAELVPAQLLQAALDVAQAAANATQGPPATASQMALFGGASTNLFLVDGWTAPPVPSDRVAIRRTQWHVMREDAGAFVAGAAAGLLAPGYLGRGTALRGSAGVVVVGLEGGEEATARVRRIVNGFLAGVQHACELCFVYDLGAVGAGDEVLAEVQLDPIGASASLVALLGARAGARAGATARLPGVVFVAGFSALAAAAEAALTVAGAAVISGGVSPELLPPYITAADILLDALMEKELRIAGGDPAPNALNTTLTPPLLVYEGENTTAAAAAEVDLVAAQARLLGRVYPEPSMAAQVAVQAGSALPTGLRVWGLEAGVVAIAFNLTNLEALNDTLVGDWEQVAATVEGGVDAARIGLMDATLTTGVDVRTGELLGELNRPPVMTAWPDESLTVHEGEELSVQFEAFDPDENAVIFAPVGELPPGAALVAATGRLNWVPAFSLVSRAAGSLTYDIKVVALDTRGLASATRSTTVTVVDANQPPRLDRASVPSLVQEGEWLIASLTASDPEGDAFSFELVPPSPPRAELLPNGTLAWRASYEEARTVSFSVRITDSLGDSAVFVVPVTVVDQGRAPVWREPLPPSLIEVEAGGFVQFQVLSSDPDDELLPVTYSLAAGTHPLVEIGYTFRGTGDGALDEVTVAEPLRFPPSVFWYVPVNIEGYFEIGIVATDQWGDPAETVAVGVVVTLQINCTRVPVRAASAEPSVIWGGGTFGEVIVFLDFDPSREPFDDNVADVVAAERLDDQAVLTQPQRNDTRPGAPAYVLMQRPEPDNSSLYDLLPTIHEAPLYPSWSVASAPPGSAYLPGAAITGGAARVAVGFVPDVAGEYMLEAAYDALNCSGGEGTVQRSAVRVEAECNSPPTPRLEPYLEYKWWGDACFPRVRLDARPSTDAEGDPRNYLMWLEGAPPESAWAKRAPSLGAVVEDVACADGWYVDQLTINETDDGEPYFYIYEPYFYSGPTDGSRMCFHPDVVGSYTFGVNVSDGCTGDMGAGTIEVKWHPRCVNAQSNAGLLVPLGCLVAFFTVLQTSRTQLRAARDPAALLSTRAAHVLRDVLALRRALVLTPRERVTMALGVLAESLIGIQLVAACAGLRGSVALEGAPPALVGAMRGLAFDASSGGAILVLPSLFLVAAAAAALASRMRLASGLTWALGGVSSPQTPATKRNAFGENGLGKPELEMPIVIWWRTRFVPFVRATTVAIVQAQPWSALARAHLLDIMLLPVLHSCFAMLYCRYLSHDKPYNYLISSTAVQCWAATHVMMVLACLTACCLALSTALRVLPAEDRVLRPTRFVRADFVVYGIVLRVAVAGASIVLMPGLGALIVACMAVFWYNHAAVWRPNRGLGGAANARAAGWSAAAAWASAIGLLAQLGGDGGQLASAGYTLAIAGAPFAWALGAWRCGHLSRLARASMESMHLADAEDDIRRDAKTCALSDLPLGELLATGTPRVRMVAAFAALSPHGSWEARAVRHVLRDTDIDLNDAAAFFETAFDVDATVCLEQAAMGLRYVQLFEDDSGGARCDAGVYGTSAAASVIDAEDCKLEDSPSYMREEAAELVAAYLRPPTCVLAARYRTMRRLVQEVRASWAGHTHSKTEAAVVLARTGVLATLTQLVGTHDASEVALGSPAGARRSGQGGDRARNQLKEARALAAMAIGEVFGPARGAMREEERRRGTEAAARLQNLRALRPWRASLHAAAEEEVTETARRQRLAEPGYADDEDSPRASDDGRSVLSAATTDVMSDIESGGFGSASFGANKAKGGLVGQRIAAMRAWAALPPAMRTAVMLRSLSRLPERIAAWLSLHGRLLPSLAYEFVMTALLGRKVTLSGEELALEAEVRSATSQQAGITEAEALRALVVALGVRGDDALASAAGKAIVAIASRPDAADALIASRTAHRLFALTRHAPSRGARSLAAEAATLMESALPREAWVRALVDMMLGPLSMSDHAAVGEGGMLPVEAAACAAAALAVLFRLACRTGVTASRGGSKDEYSEADDSESSDAEDFGCDESEAGASPNFDSSTPLSPTLPPAAPHADAVSSPVGRRGALTSPLRGSDDNGMPFSASDGNMKNPHDIRLILAAGALATASDLLAAPAPEVRSGAASLLGALGAAPGAGTRAVCGERGGEVIWRLRALADADRDASVRQAAAEALLRVSAGSRRGREAILRFEAARGAGQEWKSQAWHTIAGSPTFTVASPLSPAQATHAALTDADSPPPQPLAGAVQSPTPHHAEVLTGAPRSSEETARGGFHSPPSAAAPLTPPLPRKLQL